MPVLFDRTCILCGRVLPAEKRSAALCPDWARELRTEYRYHGEFSVPGADGAAAALCYRGAVKEALHRFKFGGRPQYAAWFAAEMAAVLTAQLDRWQPTCITYLPLGFLRARERGYNQAELLARPIAQSLSLPCVSALLCDAPHGLPYPGAKEHYLLDPEDHALLEQLIPKLEALTPLPKPRRKRPTPDAYRPTSL